MLSNGSPATWIALVSSVQVTRSVLVHTENDAPVSTAARRGADFEDVQRRVPNTDRLFEFAGKRPAMPLDKILDDVIAWKKAELGL